MADRDAKPTRDERRYWNARPEDHSADGLYRDGPHEKRPPWTALVASGPAREAPMTPTVAHSQARQQRARARASLRKRPTGYAGLLAAVRALPPAA